MKSLRRPKAREQAVEEIQRFIRREKLAPGDRLPTESELAKSFGISRLTVREATKALEFLGIVEAKTGVGLKVSQFDWGRLTGHLGFHPGLLHADPVQLIHSRVILETGVLPHLVRNMAADSSIELQLRELVEGFRTARDLKSWIGLDIQFHRSILESSGLQPLVAFGDLLHVFFQRFRESVKRAEWQTGVESHNRLVDFLSAGDLAAATAELKSHIESHLERI